jgi:ATP-binding cassette subfamily A (ABC1) protein 3
MLLLLPLLILYLRQTSTMLSEKEKKIRETMKIMGMTGFIYYVTWFIRYFAVYLVVHLICSVILARTFTYVSIGVFVITFLLFDIVLIVQSLFIQVFFTRAKVGMVISLLFFVVQYVVSFLVRNSDNPTLQQAVLGSISPHSAYTSAMQLMVYAQSV